MTATRRHTLTGLAAGAAMLALPGSARAQAGFDGDYGGVLNLGAARLRLRLVIAGERATLYSLDQGNAPIPASKVERSGSLIRLEFAAIGATYRTRLEGTRLVGEFNQGRAVTLEMVRGATPDDASGLAALLTRPMDQSLLAAIRDKLGTPGMAVAWHRTGNSQVALADGVRARGFNTRVEPRDRWHIGSITKSFTATLFACAVDAGAIRWDTRLGQQLKDVPKAHAGLTAIELLSHHGGLPTDIPMPELMALPRVEADPRATRRHYARIALAQPPVAAPRSKFAYSNVGYVLAAIMLEEATGLSWEALIRRELFEPLELQTAGFGPPGTLNDYLEPGGHAGDQPIFLDNPSAMAPAGGLHIGMYDLLTYLAAHRGKPAFLKPETWRELHTPRFGGRYALGWHVDADGSLWHNGSNTAWYAEVSVEPASRLVTAVCANDTALLSRHRLLLPAIRHAAGVAG